MCKHLHTLHITLHITIILRFSTHKATTRPLVSQRPCCTCVRLVLGASAMNSANRWLQVRSRLYTPSALPKSLALRSLKAASISFSPPVGIRSGNKASSLHSGSVGLGPTRLHLCDCECVFSLFHSINSLSSSSSYRSCFSMFFIVYGFLFYHGSLSQGAML